MWNPTTSNIFLTWGSTRKDEDSGLCREARYHELLFWPRNDHLLCETAMGIHFGMMTSLGAYWRLWVQ
jgi:hypothetical protein